MAENPSVDAKEIRMSHRMSGRYRLIRPTNNCRGSDGPKEVRLKLKATPNSNGKRVAASHSEKTHKLKTTLKRGGARYDFNDFVGYCGLSHAIHIKRQTINKLTCVLGSRVHSGHACTLFRSN